MICIPRIVLLSALALAASACAGTRLDDSLERVPVDRDLQTNKILAVPGGRWVVVETAGGGNFGPYPRLMVWEEGLRPVVTLPNNVADSGVSSDGMRLVLASRGGPRVLDLPTLHLRDRLDPAPDNLRLTLGGGAWAIPARPDRRGWAVVQSSGVLRIDEDPPRTGPAGTTAIRRLIAGAIDDATGLLVLLGDENRVEGFDLDRMESRYAVELPCRRVSFDVAARGGRAWIGTKDGSGTMIEIDVATGTHTRTYDLGLPGDVLLTASCDGARLATVSTRFVEATHHPAVLKVFRIAPEGLLEVASHEAALPCATNDVAIVPEWGTVLLAGIVTIAWRYDPSLGRPRP